jgi:replicative DNA helicase
MLSTKEIGVAVAEVTDMTTKRKIALHRQLVDFLAVPETAQKIYNERFHSDFLTEEESTASQILEYQMDHITRYGEPATPEVLNHRFPHVGFEEPVCELEWLLDQFRTRYSRNQAEGIIKAAASSLNSNPMEVIADAHRQLGKLRDRTRPQAIMYGTTDYKHVLDGYKLQLEMMGSNTGIPFGFDEIDEHLGGLKKGELVYVIGRPKRYKSWMLMKSAVAAQKRGYNAVFFTLEMSKDEMFHRYACMATGIGWKRFKRGEMSAHEWSIMESKLEELAEGPGKMHVVQPPRGDRSVDNLKAIAKDLDADVVYIDQLKFIESVTKNGEEARHQRIEYINEDLKDLTNHFPIMIAAQFNREAENMKEMADLSKIGLSDSIGQTADVLFGLYQNKDMRQSGILEFGIIEARAYDGGSWELSVELSMNSNFRVVDVKQ